MEKFSVKKPYTVLVGVIMVLVLGIVSVMNMTTDLLPSISLPYLLVITSYPGASPERVEMIVSDPMESALGTISGVKNVMSVSAENYSLTQLEFEDGTDMDSATVKVSSAVTQVHSQLPEGVGTQMGRGMAIVIVSGLIYSTLMTLIIVPVMYDILYKKPPLSVNIGDGLDDIPDDAGELIRQMQEEREKKAAGAKGAGGADSAENADSDVDVTFMDLD